MRARALVAVAVLASSLAATCGDNRFPIQILASQEVEAYCEQVVRCGEYLDVNTCLYELDPADFRLPPIIQRALNPDFVAAVGSGVMLYDDGYARACVDAIAAESCDPTSRDQRVDPDACAAMFVGLIDENQPCAFDQECSSGRCTPPAECPDDYSCCFGTCASAPHTVGSGSACAIDSDCAIGAFCTGAGCAPLLASGASCSTSTDCDFGLSCIRPSPTESGECAPLPQLGEACPGHACASIGTICGSGGTCVALGLPSQPCTTGADCGPGQVCTGSGACGPAPALGDACVDTCAVGSWCNNIEGAGGICEAPLANGMECDYAEQCQSDFCADGEFAETCIDRPVCY